MSSLFENSNLLISETEFFMDDKVIYELLNDIKGSTKRYYAKNVVANIAGTAVGVAGGFIGGSIVKAGIMKGSLGLAKAGAGMMGLSAIAPVAASFGYPIYKYLTSYHRLSQKVTKVSDLLDEAKRSKDQNKIIKYSKKLEKWKARLEKAKASLRRENANFIDRTHIMRAKLVQMKKQGSDKTTIDTLEKKLGEREAFIKKIGAKI